MPLEHREKLIRPLDNVIAHCRITWSFEPQVDLVRWCPGQLGLAELRLFRYRWLQQRHADLYHRIARRLMRYRLIVAAVLLCFAGAARVSLVQAAPPPQPSQVPPPPPLQGVVHHIAPSGGDQTWTIQATINRAGSGDTIFFDAGGHVVCGTVNMKAGQLYIGPSATYPLLGQNSRAVLDGCSYTGQFVPASTTMLYGLTMNNFKPYVIANTTGHKVRDNIFDSGDPNSSFINLEWLCNGGDTDTTVDWNTFQYGSGINNAECAATGSGSTNFLLTRNHFIQCKNDCYGPTDDGAVNEVASFNLFERPGQNCQGCGTASAIETAGVPHDAHYLNNYVIGELPGGPFCLSIIAGNREVGFNYCGGNGAAIEWDPHFTQTGATMNVHDNFLDERNISGADDNPIIFGPYSAATGSTLANNRLLSSSGVGTERELDGNGNTICTFSPTDNCSSTGYGVAYTSGPTDNPGAPAPPAAGSAP